MYLCPLEDLVDALNESFGEGWVIGKLAHFGADTCPPPPPGPKVFQWQALAIIACCFLSQPGAMHFEHYAPISPSEMDR